MGRGPQHTYDAEKGRTKITRKEIKKEDAPRIFLRFRAIEQERREVVRVAPRLTLKFWHRWRWLLERKEQVSVGTGEGRGKGGAGSRNGARRRMGRQWRAKVHRRRARGRREAGGRKKVPADARVPSSLATTAPSHLHIVEASPGDLCVQLVTDEAEWMSGGAMGFRGEQHRKGEMGRSCREEKEREWDEDMGRGQRHGYGQGSGRRRDVVNGREEGWRLVSAVGGACVIACGCGDQLLEEEISIDEETAWGRGQRIKRKSGAQHRGKKKARTTPQASGGAACTKGADASRIKSDPVERTNPPSKEDTAPPQNPPHAQGDAQELSSPLPLGQPPLRRPPEKGKARRQRRKKGQVEAFAAPKMFWQSGNMRAGHAMCARYGMSTRHGEAGVGWIRVPPVGGLFVRGASLATLYWVPSSFVWRWASESEARHHVTSSFSVEARAVAYLEQDTSRRTPDFCPSGFVPHVPHSIDRASTLSLCGAVAALPISSAMEVLSHAVPYFPHTSIT
ncbi:hypothetical protein C8R44DRAFT_858061 [Mycena epipterygia]|nr:hypothetical protein C8R44DRAFT_858061 [Mycena epipterygia]